MGTVEEIQQVCRLCLVKDEVNIPIFDEDSDIRQTFLKISSCLPVKVSPEDNLPKKICDGCSYKLDMLYGFRNTSVESEKQLIQWLNDAGLSTSSASSATRDGLMAKPEILVKQEALDPSNEHTDASDAQVYLAQQQKLPYPQEFAFGEVTEEAASTAELLPETEEPPPKRTRRSRAAAKKAPPPPEESDEDDIDTSMQITKAEDDDSEDIDQPDYVEAPSTSADDQPGPSGVGKEAVEAPPDRYSCEICKKSFKQRCYYKDHVTSHKYPDGRPCPLCDKKLKDSSSYRKHVRGHKTGPHICPKCDKVFGYRKTLLQHLKMHEENYKPASFPCDFCSQCYRQERNLKRHIKHNHGEKKLTFLCLTCGRSLSSKKSLRDHELIHTGERPFVCTLCGNGFRKNEILTEHMKRHVAEKPFLCKFCTRAFASSHGLKNHTNREHHGKKNLCETCGKEFATAESLKVHKRSHTGEKPFSCSYCPKSFAKKTHLVNHERIHTKEKPFSCQNCEKAFAQWTSLSLHIKSVHTKERPFKCNICTKRFVTKSLLRVHSNTHCIEQIN